MTDEELTLEEALGILEEPEPDTEPIWEPPENASSYIVWTARTVSCTSRRCSDTAIVKVKGIPYCPIHAIQFLADLLEEKITHHPNRTLVEEQILRAHTLANQQAGDNDKNLDRTRTSDLIEELRYRMDQFHEVIGVE